MNTRSTNNALRPIQNTNGSPQKLLHKLPMQTKDLSDTTLTFDDRICNISRQIKENDQDYKSVVQETTDERSRALPLFGEAFFNRIETDPIWLNVESADYFSKYLSHDIPVVCSLAKLRFKSFMINAETTRLKTELSSAFLDCQDEQENAPKTHSNIDVTTSKLIILENRIISLENELSHQVKKYEEERAARLDLEDRVDHIENLLQNASLANDSFSIEEDNSTFLLFQKNIRDLHFLNNRLTVSGQSYGWKNALGSDPLPGSRVSYWTVIIEELPFNSAVIGITGCKESKEEVFHDNSTIAWNADNRVFIYGKSTSMHGGWVGWQTNDVAVFKYDPLNRTLSFHHDRTDRVFTMTNLARREFRVFVGLQRCGSRVLVQPATLVQKLLHV
eukprot:gene8725-18038_t